LLLLLPVFRVLSSSIGIIEEKFFESESNFLALSLGIGAAP
jgi:hypothetical protein